MIATSESSSPAGHRAHAASYEVAVGGVSITVNGSPFLISTPSKVAAVLTSFADIGVVSATVGSSPIAVPFTGTVYLEPGSWKQSVPMHPRAFSPSLQNIAAATSATGPGSKPQYTFEGSTTILGITGTASSTN